MPTQPIKSGLLAVSSCGKAQVGTGGGVLSPIPLDCLFLCVFLKPWREKTGARKGGGGGGGS